MKSKSLKQLLANYHQGGKAADGGFDVHSHLGKDSMDDVTEMSVTDENFVLGSYSLAEWVRSTTINQWHIQGKQTLQKRLILTAPGSNFDLADWVVEMEFQKFTFTTNLMVLIQEPNVLIEVYAKRRKLEVELMGSVEEVLAWQKIFESKFVKAENLITWVYNTRGDEVQIPLNYRPLINSAYPWIKENPSNFITNYLSSDASILILIGPPGTGKTTFIKNIIHQSGGGARVSYSEDILAGDDFFAQFIDGDDDIMVMEDADNFLASRQDGNTMMHKFLNVSDGLISAASKKIIFSTNLPNISDIDPALMRPGRCFDTIQFRKLTREESKQVYTEVNSDRQLPDGNEFSLAELFGEQQSTNTQKRSMGFL